MKIPDLSRRDFVKISASTAGAAVLANLSIPRALGATVGSDRIRVGVVGCGGRGTGAAKNCVESSAGVDIVALADLFPWQVEAAKKKLKVPNAHGFTGFDAYEKLLATDIDLVILTTPPGFRPSHFAAAIAAGKHVFLEKPVAVDPVGVRSVIETARLAKQKRLAVVAGTQRRHQPSYMETMKRINGGDLGELVAGQCYWNGDGIWFREKNDPKFPDLAKLSDFEWQCWNWYHWDWLSGDQIVEQHLHNLDVMNWAFGGPPAKFYGMGGRQNRGSLPGNIWDHFAVEMEYPNGARVTSMCRHTPKSTTRIAERVVGTRGMSDCDKGTIKGEKAFAYAGAHPDPYVVEHTDLINSIRGNAPLNEGEQVALSTMTAIGGRMAAYTGREISWKWLMEGSKLDIFPKNPAPGAGLFGAVPIPGKIELV
ncbi:MAG: twin-arginine translocation signal domain-containing protein [Opitutus sp.]|nr:twin-arginine translocation signal domain-containing protein [Opitutus sp.]